MRCPVCGNNDPSCTNMKKGAKVFYVHMRMSYKDHSNLPCHVRKFFSKSKYLPAKAPDGAEYMFKLVKDGEKTRILGADYDKFLEEYDMAHKNKIKFKILQNDSYLSMAPLDVAGSIIAKVNWVEADELEEHLTGHYVRAIVVSGGMKLNPLQMDNIHTCIAQRGTGLGGIFVHRMQTSDILNNGMRIPKHIVSVLDIRRSGRTILAMDEVDGINYADYYTSTDGRIRFRTGWPEFSSDFYMEEGDTVLIMFHMVDNMLQISFDYI